MCETPWSVKFGSWHKPPSIIWLPKAFWIKYMVHPFFTSFGDTLNHSPKSHISWMIQWRNHDKHPITLPIFWIPQMTFWSPYSISKIFWRVLPFSMPAFQFPSLWHLWISIWQSGLRVVWWWVQSGLMLGREDVLLWLSGLPQYIECSPCSWESLDFSLQISPLLGETCVCCHSFCSVYMLQSSPMLSLCDISQSHWGCPYRLVAPKSKKKTIGGSATSGGYPLLLIDRASRGWVENNAE